MQMSRHPPWLTIEFWEILINGVDVWKNELTSCLFNWVRNFENEKAIGGNRYSNTDKNTEYCYHQLI